MSDARVAALVEKAFDYRGFVTLSKQDGSKLVGFVFNRDAEMVEVLDESAATRIQVPMREIADVEFSGEDTAAKSVQIWERRKGTLESPETSAWGDWEMERPALIIVALENELRGAARAIGGRARGSSAKGKLGDGRAVAVAVGMGGGAQRAVQAEKPGLVISLGFSGALQSGLKSGSLVLATAVSDESGETLYVEPAILAAARKALEGIPFQEGELVCATRVAATEFEKRALGKSGRLAVDLESWPAAKAAQEAGIPWIGLRAILDPLEDELPAFTRVEHKSYLGPALRYALGGPSAIAELAQLGFRARAANLALEQALQRLGPVLDAAARPQAASQAASSGARA